ncbi:Phosphoserine transaminase [Chlamydiales bacterium SCGC AG-110-M15]|nr:Phosphoserine transaminase [Chlamydiales bacterium SCGC AG-110-M15]
MLEPNLTFSPGPSKIHEETLEDIRELSRGMFLSTSHRSAAFTDMSRRAIEGMHDKLGIPSDYRIFYQASATGCMHTILGNVVKSRSQHFVNGAFSNRFYQFALDLAMDPLLVDIPWGEAIDWESIEVPEDVELVALTHNESSTSVMWPREALIKFREKHPRPLISIDATSTMGSLNFPWEAADLWFGSVQKCLGMPSGLGLLIVSPRAFEIGVQNLESLHRVPGWQRFDILEKHMGSKYQTLETPNLFGIALLAKAMERLDIEATEKRVLEQAKFLYESIKALSWESYVKDPLWRSCTLCNIELDNPEAWRLKALENGMVIGKGYGVLSDSCIRIANFPAITMADLERLFRAFGQ